MKKEFKNVVIEICESLISCVKADDFDGIAKTFHTLQNALQAFLSVHSFEEFIQCRKEKPADNA